MSYTVRFLNYAGDDLLGVVVCEAGEDITDRAPTPEVFEGKVFLGWNVPITNIQEDMTVRPTYAGECTVRFLNYEGTDLLASITCAAGDDITDLAPTPEEIEGLKFTGWSADITNVQEDMTVRGVYVTATYTVTFWAKDESYVITTEVVEHGGTATPPEPPVEEGFDFVYWSGSMTNVTSDRDIYAIYRVSTYTVTFYDRDGVTIMSQQTVTHKGDAIAPSPTYYERYIFIKWSQSYRKVISSRKIYAVYREVPRTPNLAFYAANADGSCGDLIKTYRGVNSCTLTQKLDGESTIELKLQTAITDNVVGIRDYLEVNGLVFYITELKKTISNGICYSTFTGEHISYLLNDEAYQVEAYDDTGKPEDVLYNLLKDTPFEVAGVDDFGLDSVTVRVNKTATRRAVVMQLIATLGGEIEYYGYTIAIRKHVGSTNPISIMQSNLVQDISTNYNSTEETTNISINLYQKSALQIGDELYIKFAPLGLDMYSRIVGWSYNPFNYKEVSITVGEYLPTINESLYQVSTEVSDLSQATAKYTIEFCEIIGNGEFYFTRAYRDRPYFLYKTDSSSAISIELLKSGSSAFGTYIGAKITGADTTATSFLTFYLAIPEDTDEN